MSLRWTDIQDIAIELAEAYPDQDPMQLRFTDLHSWVCQLPDFADDPEKSNERILEAIILAWQDERD
ncbi:Fe-S cluster assembly protein IscX [Aliagarivorans marinus]|uniref:Fe-S cluster assembly protein IscX n=1 Tax=Aliagarivorans marinus TaxID=561965 RepID=UPI0004039336|nr:Fe-S cluster assembly protein IscX [Aliagarivorans marinus]